MKTICRLCLKPAIDGVSFHYTDSSGFSTSSLVKALVPELYLGLSPNPVVCKTCYFHLRQAYVFRLRCLRSENLIGIYIRETKNNENLILLDDVVSFWKKRYKNRSDDLQCSLEEWFGKAGDKPGEPIILNQTASIVGSDNSDIRKDIAEDKIQEDESSDLQMEIFKSSEKEKTAECTDDCPDTKECSYKFNKFKREKEKTNKEKTTDKNDDDIIVIQDVAKEFDEFMNKACVETPEETTKIVLDDTESQTSKVKCRSKPLTKIVKVLTQTKRPQSESSAERSKDTTEMIKLVVDGLSHSSKEQYTAVLKLPPKIPTKQSNIDSEKKNIPQKMKTQRRINLICDFDDMDINSFVKELQKDENIKKLGLSNNSFGDCNSYFLKKFIDKSDNSLSFALLPKHDEDKPRREADVDVANKNTLLVNEDKTETFVDGKNLQKENANEKPQVINEPVEVVKEKCNIEDSMKKNPSVSTTSGNQNEAKFIINDGTEATEPQMGICIKDCPDARLNEEKKDEEKCKKALIENVAEVNSNTKNLERVPILLNDKIEPEKGNPPQPPDPLSSTPQDKPPAIPMPIIRVKPASALQKVRTLNHELWPQKKTINYSEDSLPVLYPLSKPQFHHGLPAKMADVEKRAPIVLNSQLDLHGRIPKEHESSPMPPSKLKGSLPMPLSKLKGKRPVLKTYRRKVAGAPQVLKRVNPLTYKALEEMQKLGLIKVVGIVDESQVSERIQQSVSNVTVKQGAKMVNFEDFLDNSGHDLEICGDDQKNAGDRLGNSGDSTKNCGARQGNSGDRTKNCGARQGNSGDRTGDSGDGLGNVIDRRGSRDEKNEFAIDIKEEPLNCAESDVLMNFGDDDRVAESEGETTRSASETSFMDTINSQNDLVKTIMDNIPEVGEEQYDVPEYVHINNVTFSDLTKLMGESKIHRENAVKTQMQPPEPNVTKINPLRLKTRITNIITKELKPTVQTDDAQSQSGRSRTGKRLRLVQVDADGKEIEDVGSRIRRRKLTQSVLKNNVDRRCVPRISENENGNVCVLYTNFTSEGDYINDHDYLINPYMRNKLFHHHGFTAVCLCLLCDLKHKASDHIDHMKSHKTVCEVCRVDFHNVFILNLHVRCHSTYCSECNITVSYASHMAHALEHNKSLTLSNIDIPDDVLPDYLQKPAEATSQPGKERESSRGKKTFPSLAELLNQPVIETNSRVRTSSSSPSVSPRRSRRITRSTKKYEEDYLDNEEEACIYDKTTRSFITPSAEKQQKLLDKCSSDNPNTDSNKIVDTYLSSDKSENLKKEDMKTQETDINLSMLLCNESIEKTDTEISSTDSKPSLLKAESAVIDQDKITETKPKKHNKSIKRKRKKGLMMPRKKSKFLTYQTQSIKIQTSNVNNKPKNTDALNLTSPESNKKYTESVKSDLVALDDVNGSANIASDLCKITKSKKSIGILRKDLVAVKTYSRSGNRERDTSKVDVLHPTSPAKTGGKPTAVSTPPSETTDGHKTKKYSSKPGKFNKKIQKATLPKSSITTGNLSDCFYVPLETTTENNTNLKSQDNTKVFLTSTESSQDSIKPSENSIKTPKKSAKSSKNSVKKSPQRVDLKMKIKGLNCTPFVSLTDVFTEVPKLKEKLSKDLPETMSRILRTDDGAGRNKKGADDSSEINPLPLVEKKSEISVVDNNIQERLSSSHANENTYETLKGKEPENKKDFKSDKLSNSKPRSSRSRGSLGLVEGLKGNEKRMSSSRKLKKSHSSLQDHSSGNLDTSQLKNEDLKEHSRLSHDETADKASVSYFKTTELKITDVNQSLVLKNVEADVNDKETLKIKKTESSESSTSDSNKVVLQNNKQLTESSSLKEN